LRRILVTGAAGYIGGAIIRALADGGWSVIGGVRRDVAVPPYVTPFITGDLAQFGTDFPPVDAVVHAAGLGHRRGVPRAVWHAANVDAAVNVASAARRAGASRFVLISTAHVHGRIHDGVVTDATPPHPMDDYATSKLEAEAAVGAAFGAGLTIIRPVAVIGPNCPGNLQLLMKFLRAGIPLPFASIRNARSFIQVNDLARLVALALRANAPPAVMLAAHPAAIATPELIRALADGMNLKPRLLPCPPALLAAGAAAAGRAAMWQSLAGSFCSDPAAALALGWTPAQSLRESLVDVGRYHNTTHMIP
jgi:UDP-glucose 4-epimerase